MLGKGYISINGSTVANPVDYSIEFDRNESSYKTEAGKEIVYVRGSDKAVLSTSFASTSFLKARLETLYHTRGTATISVAGVTYTDMYIDSFSASLVSGSERTPNTDGLWNVELKARQL